MSHKFDECVKLGYQSPIINDQLSTEVVIAGFLECERCGAVTEIFEEAWLIENNKGNYESISGILAEEEEAEKIYEDNLRIDSGLK